MKTKLRWLHILLIPMLLTGCWDYMPLEERFIVNALGIDISEQRPREIIVTVMGTTYQKDNETIQAEGKSISDAFHNIRHRMDKDMALSHIKTIIISDQVARQGILPYLDIFYRDPQIRSDGLITIVTGKANDYMNEDKLSYPIDGAFIFDVINRSETVIDIQKYDIQKR
jgi:spore germination protein KC